MKIIIAAGLLAALAATTSAQETAPPTGSAPTSAPSYASGSNVRAVGVGVILGEPIGGTVKLWLDDRLAADVGAGLSDGNAGFWADALWHDWTLLPQPSTGRLGVYLGAGPQLRTGGDVRFGIRAIGGLSYRPTGHPLELFAEAGPLFRLTQGGQVDAVGGVGLRLMVGRQP